MEAASSLSHRERRQWTVVISLLVAMILVAGPTFGVYGVFFTPLLKEFHVTRAQISSLTGALFLALGLSAPAIGWLIDRVDARLIAMAGTSLSIAGFALASSAHSLGLLMIAHVLMGVGVTAACIITTAFVIANWFGANRGTALGVAFAGLAAGPMIMTILSSHLVSSVGWRGGYFIFMIPMLTVVLPIQFAFVRSRPPGEVAKSPAAATKIPLADSGFDLFEALARRSFWLIVLTNFFFAFATTALSLHIIPYLVSVGYKPTTAALAMGITFAFGAPGNIFFGWFADKVRNRTALSVSLAGIALAVLLLLGASQIMVLAAFIVIYGIAHQGPAFVVPLTIAESVGLRRFGSISGLIGLVSTFASTLGPIAAGRLFDATGSYRAPLTLFVVMLIISAVFPLGCIPFGEAAAGEPQVVAVTQ